jgi:hypothetical protein
VDRFTPFDACAGAFKALLVSNPAIETDQNMTLQKIADDISTEIGGELAKRGLKPVIVPSRRPHVENHMIEFHDERGRRLNLRVQVDARTPSWERCAVTIDRIERAALGSTGYNFEGVVGTRIRSLKTDDGGTATKDLLFKLSDGLVVICPLDSLEAQIVTDYRFVEVVSMLERFAEMQDDEFTIAFEARGKAKVPNTASLTTSGGRHADVILGVSDDFVDAEFWTGDGLDFHEWSASSLSQFSRAMEEEIIGLSPTMASSPQLSLGM